MVTAIEVFSDCIPAKRSRQVALESKRIRRAAGKARDCDVLIERYERTHGEGTDDDVLAELNKHRRQAQEPLVRLRKRLQGLDYAKQLDALIARVAWRGGGREPTFATVARNELAPLVAQFFSFSINESTELQELHEMRICGKRLRYAIELLAAGFPPSLRRRVYPKFVKIQQSLGDLHDHVAAARRLKEWCQETDGKSAARSLNRLRRAEKQEAAAKSRDFHEWWQGEAKRLEKRFRKLL